MTSKVTQNEIDDFFANIKNLGGNLAKGMSAFHFEYRDKMNGEPPSYSEVLYRGNGWERMKGMQAALHEDPNTSFVEEKWVKKEGVGSREVIFTKDKNGVIIPYLHPTYRGSYNYISASVLPPSSLVGLVLIPFNFTGHFLVDMVPGFFGGNIRGTRNDFKPSLF